MLELFVKTNVELPRMMNETIAELQFSDWFECASTTESVVQLTTDVLVTFIAVMLVPLTNGCATIGLGTNTNIIRAE